jgi:Na+-transporting methylmalonyl-CoA/oxaloacetate decarboxylase gamma subunit
MNNWQTMTFFQSFQVSLLGFGTVFICLIALYFAVHLFSLIFSLKNNSSVSGNHIAGNNPEPVNSVQDIDVYAAVMVVLCEETGLPPDQFKIKNIREIKV